MSKELEALEEAKDLTHRLITSGSWDKIEEQLNIVEVALKELEVMKQIKFIVADVKTSDEVLEKLKNQRVLVGNLEPCEIKPLFDEETQKKLKALNIIKDKEVNVHFLLVCMNDFSNNDEVGREEYNKQEGSYWHTANALTQEEYNLLKEVLK